jgi:hypothetical protein
MNRWRLVVSWIFLLVGGWGGVILLLASPITAAIFSGGAMLQPWELGEKVSWGAGLVSAIGESWRWLAAVVACAALAFAGGRLQAVLEARRLRAGNDPR